MITPAIRNGWRVWLADDRLLPGEVLCPAHRHDPMNKREAPEKELACNLLRAAGLLSTAGEGDKHQ